MAKIYVIHENDAWVEPLRAALAEQELRYEEWFLSEGVVDVSIEPPQGVFYNRMSASSHTRGHRYAPEITAGVLAWLESFERRVVNRGRALQLELSKLDQYATLTRFGIRTPRTVAAVGRNHVAEAAKSFEGSFITKHNRAGKGLGVRLFHTHAALEDYVHSSAFEDSVDGNDVNTNTNYNPDAEREAGIYGMRAIARYLGRELGRLGAPGHARVSRIGAT